MRTGVRPAAGPPSLKRPGYPAQSIRQHNAALVRQSAVPVISVCTAVLSAPAAPTMPIPTNASSKAYSTDEIPRTSRQNLTKKFRFVFIVLSPCTSGIPNAGRRNSQRIQLVAIVRCGHVTGEHTDYQRRRDCSVNLRSVVLALCRHMHVRHSRLDDSSMPSR